MNNFKFLLSVFFLAIIYSSNASSVNRENSFIFIENQIDNEYFITPESLDPRFTGANVFTKYSSSSQDSLGYMGANTTGILSNRYIDIWLENSPIPNPFIGNRCMRNASGCSNSGLWPAGSTLKDGAYKIRQTGISGQSNYVRPIFSSNAYEYFKNLTTGSSEILHIKACRTNTETQDYDLSKGQTCENTGGRILMDDQFKINKIGHIKLVSNNALQEIFIDTDGNPSIGLGNKFCSIGVVSNKPGLICKLVNYNMKNTKEISRLYLGLKLNPSYLTENQNKDTVMIGDGGSNWFDYTIATSNPNTTYTRIMKNGSGDIYLYLSNVFLKKLITDKIDLSRSQDFFTLAFYNSRTPESGYYEFTPSNTLIIKPRNYGVSIISSDLVKNPTKTGKIGDSPLVFNYIVTTSAHRQADSITAQVIGKNTIIKNQSYCVFSSADESINVPFSAYLSYTSDSGSKVNKRASCDSTEISIKDALWSVVPWDVPSQNEGSFFRTNLDLTFPMNEGPSYWSLEGEDWIGSVTGTGEIKIIATWTGPDILE